MNLSNSLPVNSKSASIYNFMDYKRKKPFFRQSLKIRIASPIQDTYYMVKNLVYEGKQILALKKEHDPNTIVLVEGKFIDGQLVNISMIPEESLGEISRIFARTI